MVKYVKGDLLDSNCDYICHQVNCQGVMGSGIAKQIRELYPEVYISYKDICDSVEALSLLGSIDIVDVGDEHHVISIFGQLNYGYDGKRYTSYPAFANALAQISDVIPDGASIGFPKNIGCGLGGADWECISTLIEVFLGAKCDVYIYELED